MLEELILLWKGVLGYDVLQPARSKTFTLGIGILDILHIFFEYGIVGRFANSRYVVCPPCKLEFIGVHSVELGKHTYSKAQRWLPKGCLYRTKAMKAHFDGQSEFQNKPMTITAEEELRKVVEMRAWLEGGVRAIEGTHQKFMG